MAIVKYGDVVPDNDSVVSLEEKLKRRRASSEETTPQNPNEQTETQNNEPKKRSV